MGANNLVDGLLVLEAVDEAGRVLGATQGGGDLLQTDHRHKYDIERVYFCCSLLAFSLL